METIRAERSLESHPVASPVDEYLRLRREATMIEARAAALLGEIDGAAVYAEVGYLSAAAMLSHLAGDSAGAAAWRVAEARSLRRHPEIADAYSNAVLDRPRVAMLLHAEPANPPLFRRDAAVLVDSIAGLSAAHARRAVDYWQQAASPDAAEAAERDVHQQRRLHVSEMAGMVHIDGRLTREGGEVVLTALRSITDPGLLDPDDTRTGAQRRADALVDLCADHLAHGEAPSSGGHRPQVVVTLALEALEARTGGPCELDETGVITPETARRLACDAAVTRVITGAGSEAIDVGRATRVPPAATRTALVIRDRGCTIAGCGRPHRWCDAHHLVHWADGGPTDLDNLVLLCRRHHRMVHTGEIRLPTRD